MKITINNSIVKNNTVSFNSGMNYGRFHDIEAIPYQIEFEKVFFTELLEEIYTKVRDEIYEDDSKHNETSNFTDTNYCSFSELLTLNEGLQEVFISYLDRTLFEKTLSNNGTSFTYVINSTDSIEVVGDFILVKGKCFSK